MRAHQANAQIGAQGRRSPRRGQLAARASLRPVRGRLDLPALLAHACGAAVGHGDAHGQHGGLHAAAAAPDLRGVHARGDGGDELGARVDDVGPLEERLLDAHVPVVGQAAGAGEADGARGRHEGDVGDAGQDHGPHDAVVRVHAHGGGGDHRLREEAALGHAADAPDEGMVDLAPLEGLLAVLAPGKLLGLHHAALARPLQRALLGLDAREPLLRLVLPLLLVGLLLLGLEVLL
mmetsp:Transcript_108701/g.339957  ORF Transcript_108701/g.339957 Transcript_108701/m.339957 type:complete len:235 (-) Transcript_108701:263-967(-)